MALGKPKRQKQAGSGKVGSAYSRFKERSARLRRTMAGDTASSRRPATRARRSSPQSDPAQTVASQSVFSLGEADYRAMEAAENRPVSDMPGLKKLMTGG